jgi:precorrin-6A synthase
MPGSTRSIVAPGNRARMLKLFVIGIGCGGPDQLTVQAIAALQRVDVFFVLDKGPAKADLMRLRTEICRRFIPERRYRVVEARDVERDARIEPYAARVAAWHEQRALLYEQLIASELTPGACGAFLVWGDPSLYDSTLRVLDRVRARGAVAFDCEVIPGISSVQVLAARHRVALHDVGAPVHITTGRRLAERRALPEGDDVVVMLDGECAFKALDPDGVVIYWGAYLGTEHELLIAGPLRERAPEIERARAEARARHGWIMDVYLLRRR